MSDDLLQLIFAAALVLFGLLGGKKKRPTQQPPRRRPEQPHPRPKQPAPRSTAPQPARPAPAPRPAAPAPAPQRDVLVKELERLLGVPVEVEQSGAIPEAVSLEQTDVEEKRVGQERISPERVSTRWVEGIGRSETSLETLDEAGAQSHERFHQRYAAAAPLSVAPDTRPSGSARRLRQAIIWSEILGPPVSLR